MNDIDLAAPEKSSFQNLSIHSLLKAHAERITDAVAITAPGRLPLKYGRLLDHINNVAEMLNQIGIGRNDRVATVLPNGPEMVTAFLSISIEAASAPLNPGYHNNEFEFYLSDLNAKALLTQSGLKSPAIDIARAQGISVIEISPIIESEAGIFKINGEVSSPPAERRLAEGGDVALVLHTSGTTSRPKIVPLTHTNIMTSARNVQSALGLVQSDLCLNIMPLFHIHGLIGATLSSLIAGAGIICTPGFNVSRFFGWLEEFRPTWYTAVPTIHQAILDASSEHRRTIASHPLRFIRSCSSALPPSIMAELENVFKVPVIESYGMTEAAHQMTSNPMPPCERKAGSVGIASGPEVAIMDGEGKLLPRHEIGEIVIRGANVTPGYENNPNANMAAFTNGWFRTGDQGFLDNDGYLYISGRIKEIINRGGEKIVPREIDEVLLKHPAVSQAVAFAVPHSTLGEDLAVAIVLKQNSYSTEREIREFAFDQLSDFKVPSQVIFVSEIPKGPTGKLQRIGLAQKLAPKLKAKFVAPKKPLEEILSNIWAEVLGIEQVGIRDNFFACGGDSLKATQVVSRIGKTFQVKVPLKTIFKGPTVADQAQLIEEMLFNKIEGLTEAKAQQPFTEKQVKGSNGMGDLGQRLADLSPEKRALLEPRIMQMVRAVSKEQGIPQRGALDHCPVSFAQQRLWFLDQFEPGSPVYNIPAAIRLTGLLDVVALEQSLNEIVARHEVLRTTFLAEQGEPMQVITATLPLMLTLTDLQELPEAEREVKLQRLVSQEARRPFDLSQGPLLRAMLLRLGVKDYVLLLTVHHIVSDGWSTGILFRELSNLYEAFTKGSPSPLPELPIQYADFAIWQRQWLQGDVLEEQLDYWKKQLDKAPPLLELPSDRPRPVVQAYRGAHQTMKLPMSLTEALKALSLREEVTFFMTLLAGFKTLLYRYTGHPDIIIGSPIAGRNRIEIEGLIGFFVNTLVLRTDLSGNPTFRQLLVRVREMCLGAYAHQDLPFEKLVEELQPERNLSYSPLFQVMFILQNVPRSTLSFPGLTLKPLEVDSGTAKFDLTLTLVEGPDGMCGTLEYDTALFGAATITRMARHFRILLEAIVANPEQRISELPLLTVGERHQLLLAWNDTQADYPRRKCIHQLFEEQVEKSPDAVALMFEDQQMTYQELNRRANQLAHHLQSLGVEPEVLVGICLERSIEMVVGLLGILKAGGAYVPLDPEYPRQRLSFMLKETGVPVLLTRKRLIEALPKGKAKVICLDSNWEVIAKESDENLESGAAVENRAYVMYTSGSTGIPKGVVGLHKGAVNRFHWMWKTYPFNVHEICCQKTSLSFVDSVWEIFGPLLQGIQTVVISDEIIKDPHYLIQYLGSKGVTRIVLVPSLLRAILDTYDDLQKRLPELKIWISSGEILSKELCRRFHDMMPHSKLINLYGSSEVSADVLWYDTTLMSVDNNSVPIGQPISNTQVYIFDRHLQPVPIGIPGEIHIGGDSLARGYFDRSELTSKSFITHPFSDDPSAQLYKTGDLARYLPDGNIEFLGRIDHQVKIRGFRIELGEIECVLSSHEVIKECAVVVCQDAQDNNEIVAYIVCSDSFSNLSLRRFLREKLPHYMIPSRFFQLAALPVTPNGKIDRKALSSSASGQKIRESEFVAPVSSMEKNIAEIWRSLLSVEQIGVNDNFFDLGGHSLMVIKVIFLMKKKLKAVLTIRDFMYQTLGQIAAICEQNKSECEGNNDDKEK